MQAGAPQRILVISHDVIGSRMAGTGIRYWELARVLAQKHRVTLIAPQPIDLPPPNVACGSYQWGTAASMESWLDTDIVVANGFVLLEHEHLAHIRQPLALDLYDPILLENLELWRRQDPEARDEQNRKDQALLGRQLAAGDFLMCATERQRDLLIGALMTAGRITHAVTDHDPTLRRLIDVVPFGVSQVPPVHHAPALRGIVGCIGPDDAVLLWTGGLWDWLDPQTLVRAMPEVVTRHPEARLVFLAGQHPGAIQPMRAPGEAKKLASDLGLLDTHIFFHEQWVPYEQRSSFLLEADIAVSLHHTHLETAYAAVRSRFLDHLWAGLPSVVADGDAAADLVQAKDLGLVVPPGDSAATAHALIELLDDKERRLEYAQNARMLAQDYTWDKVARALVDFCDAPRRTRSDVTEPQPPPTPAPHFRQGEQATMQPETEQLLKQMEGSWQFGALPANAKSRDRLLHEAVLRIIGPLIAQQREFNAAVVKYLYTLHEHGGAGTGLNAVMAQLMATEREFAILRSDLRARLDILQRDLHGRLDTTAEVLETIRRDANARLDTMAEFGGELNDRLTRLTYATQLLDQAVVAADEIDAVFAEEIASLHRQRIEEGQMPQDTRASAPTPSTDEGAAS